MSKRSSQNLLQKRKIFHVPKQSFFPIQFRKESFYESSHMKMENTYKRGEIYKGLVVNFWIAKRGKSKYSSFNGKTSFKVWTYKSVKLRNRMRL